MIIFDCDGVLVDTENFFKILNMEFLQSKGIDVTLDFFTDRYSGVSYENTIIKLEQDLDIKIDDAFSQEMYQYSKNQLRKRGATLVEGMDHVVASIKGPKCVASNSDHDHISFVLKSVNLYEHFAPYLFSATDVSAPKPSPDVYKFAAEQMNKNPASCLVIEDSQTGIYAAKAAGMRVVGVTVTAGNPPEVAKKLYDAGAENVFDSAGALQNFIGEFSC